MNNRTSQPSLTRRNSPQPSIRGLKSTATFIRSLTRPSSTGIARGNFPAAAGESHVAEAHFDVERADFGTQAGGSEVAEAESQVAAGDFGVEARHFGVAAAESGVAAVGSERVWRGAGPKWAGATRKVSHAGTIVPCGVSKWCAAPWEWRGATGKSSNAG